MFVTDDVTEDNAFLFGNVFVVNGDDVVAVFILSDSGLRNQQGDDIVFGFDADIDIVAGNQQVLFIVIFVVNGNGCRFRVYFIVGENRF